MREREVLLMIWFEVMTFIFYLFFSFGSSKSPVKSNASDTRVHTESDRVVSFWFDCNGVIKIGCVFDKGALILGMNGAVGAPNRMSASSTYTHATQTGNRTYTHTHTRMLLTDNHREMHFV